MLMDHQTPPGLIPPVVAPCDNEPIRYAHAMMN
jgi:hypothetical protein